MHDFPFKRTSPLEPPPEFAEIRGTEPLCKVRLWDGSEALLATRYEDVRSVLLNPAISADTSREGYPQASASHKEFRAGQRSFNRMDPPEHDVKRLMLTADFMVRRVRSYRPYLDDLVDELFDAMERKGPPVDFVDDFALIVPSRMITQILDLPEQDSVFFLERVKRTMNLNSTPAQIMQAGQEIVEYFGTCIVERTGGDGQDLISRLIRDRVQTGELTVDELQHMLHLLVEGGFDTTANMIAMGTLVFLQNPEQVTLLQNQPELLTGAIEELLRYLTVAHHVAYRQAASDMQVADVNVSKGEAVLAPIQAANHDPEVFPAPERFDITRDARGHLAFGYGIHQCLGQPLARVELQAVFAKLFTRFPSLALATDFESLEFRNAVVYGVEHVPVRW